MSAPAAVEQARVALASGTRFLSAELGGRALPAAWTHRNAALVRARYLGNCLSEVNRFFNNLLDALDPQASPGKNNSVNKLTALQHMPPPTPSTALRLRALGRSSACLRYCYGTVRRTDDPAAGWMTAGWIDPATGALRRYLLGEQLSPEPVDIVDICGFYDDLAGSLGADKAP